jgi:hypothetical protein
MGLGLRSWYHWYDCHLYLVGLAARVMRMPSP